MVNTSFFACLRACHRMNLAWFSFSAKPRMAKKKQKITLLEKKISPLVDSKRLLVPSCNHHWQIAQALSSHGSTTTVLPPSVSKLFCPALLAMAHHPSVQTVPGLGGLPKVVLRHRSGSSAEVYLFGATLTSFRTPEEKEVLFLSKKAVFDGKKALRGGVPLVFPQFGQPDKSMPSHGIARTSNWELADSALDDDTVKATLNLSSSSSLKLWPFRFLLSFTIVISSSSLITSLRIHNKGDTPFDYQTLLHTYFAVAAIDQVAVRGLRSVTYIDKLLDPSVGLITEERTDVTIAQEVDRIYKTGGPKDVSLFEGEIEKVRLHLNAHKTAAGSSEQEQLPVDMVLWNPWIEKAKGLNDLEDDEYKTMVCMEPGLVSDFHKLGPGESAVLEQIITPMP